MVEGGGSPIKWGSKMASIFDQKRGSKKCCFLGSKNDKKWRSKFDCNEGQKLCAIKKFMV